MTTTAKAKTKSKASPKEVKATKPKVRKGLTEEQVKVLLTDLIATLRSKGFLDEEDLEEDADPVQDCIYVSFEVIDDLRFREVAEVKSSGPSNDVEITATVLASSFFDWGRSAETRVRVKNQDDIAIFVAALEKVHRKVKTNFQKEYNRKVQAVRDAYHKIGSTVEAYLSDPINVEYPKISGSEARDLDAYLEELFDMLNG